MEEVLAAAPRSSASAADAQQLRALVRQCQLVSGIGLRAPSRSGRSSPRCRPRVWTAGATASSKRHVLCGRPGASPAQALEEEAHLEPGRLGAGQGPADLLPDALPGAAPAQAADALAGPSGQGDTTAGELAEALEALGRKRRARSAPEPKSRALLRRLGKLLKPIATRVVSGQADAEDAEAEAEAGLSESEGEEWFEADEALRRRGGRGAGRRQGARR